ncbi:hypothetical protein DFH07DRAFT_772080 [Mycena maculata]|uniref:F-box domain-containing protein n=1 Tax=Mycena maculata TaxID=230809 RepID=A0AAD7NGG3_9AGAR|nr:hypothetical protein DFH07DRAFT_772080 [Mycena maculata]
MNNGDWTDIISSYAPTFGHTSHLQGRSSLLSDAYVNRLATFQIFHSSKTFECFPLEILGEIIRFIPNPFVDTPSTIRAELHIICSVCRLWRELCLSDPRMWSNVYIDSRSDSGTVGKWLCRSRTMPLSITLHMHSWSSTAADTTYPSILRPRLRFQIWIPLMHILAQHMARCIRLELSADDEPATGDLIHYINRYLGGNSIVELYLMIHPLPLFCQRLAAEYVHLLFKGNMPSLRLLSLDGIFVLWGQHSNVLSNLTHIRLEYLEGIFVPTSQELFDFLRSAIHLTHLHMQCIQCSDMDNIALMPPTLSQLTHLHFSATHYSSVTLLDALDIPALKTVIIELEDNDIINQFFVRSPAVVRMLRSVSTAILSLNCQHMPTCVDAFSTLPNVIRIDCRGSPPLMTAAFHAILVHSPMMLKKVELYLWCADNFPDFLLASAVRFASSTTLHMITVRGHDFEGKVTVPYQTYAEENTRETVCRPAPFVYDLFNS